MLIGIPKEIKDKEFRVGATPSFVKELVDAGHRVRIETCAGDKIGFSDEMYNQFGAQVVATRQEVYEADMIIKVKEPQPSEFSLLKEGQILFCYLHLAAEPVVTEHLLKQKVIAIAYETVTDEYNRLPLLIPMSEMAGRIAVQAGAFSLQLNNGGKGIILGGIPGVSPANVVVIGGGIVGTESLRMALGLGASVTVFDKNLNRLRELSHLYAPQLKTLYPTQVALNAALKEADLVIGAVLIPGAKAPKIITRQMIGKMLPKTVFVDVAIDQGGCSETSRPTTHSDPTYIEEGVIHYCVTNMPAAGARTATFGLTNATMPYALKIANLGYKKALREDKHLLNGLNVFKDSVTNESVAKDLGYEYTSPEKVL